MSALRACSGVAVQRQARGQASNQGGGGARTSEAARRRRWRRRPCSATRQTWSRGRWCQTLTLRLFVHGRVGALRPRVDGPVSQRSRRDPRRRNGNGTEFASKEEETFACFLLQDHLRLLTTNEINSSTCTLGRRLLFIRLYYKRHVLSGYFSARKPQINEPQDPEGERSLEVRLCYGRMEPVR